MSVVPTSFEVLCECLSLRPQRDRVAAGLADPADHPRLFGLAEAEHVLPALYGGLQALDLLDKIEPRIREALKRWYQYNTLRNIQLRALGIEVARALNEAEIVPILMKGGVSLFDGYAGDPGHRVMADLDFLVPATDYERALGVADAMGFTEEDEHYSWTFSSNPLKRPRDVAAIEIHHLVGEQRTVLPPLEAWRNARDLDSAEASLKALSPTHRVLQNIFHSEVQDRGHLLRLIRLRQLLDLCQLAEAYRDEVDWPWLLARFRAHGLEPVLRDRLAAAALLLGFDSPPGFDRSRRHVDRCLAEARHPRNRPWREFWAGATAPLKSYHLDLLYGCGTKGASLWLCRARHVLRLVRTHRGNVVNKIDHARHIYR